MATPKKAGFTVTIDEEVLQAITDLTQALKENTLAHTGNAPVQAAEAPQETQEAPQQAPATLAPPAGYQAPPLQMPVQYQQPVQQAPIVQMPVQQAPIAQMPVQQQMPTTAPAYSVEQIMQACAQLMDANQPVLNLIQQKYGANAITEINPANYGLLVTDLRVMGAQI